MANRRRKSSHGRSSGMLYSDIGIPLARSGIQHSLRAKPMTA